jgi:uncharacterized protein YndB with AHSA1/START domain
MKDKLAIEVFYPHSPERVWQAITDSGSLSSWLMPTTFKPIPGFDFVFEGLTRQGRSTVRGTVLEVEQGKKLVYTWDDGEDDSPGVVAWTLKPTDGGTTVRLEHESVDAQSPVVLIEANMNWGYALRHRLPALLHRQPVPIVFVEEEPETEDKPKPRAGFRQEAASCR